MTEQDELITDIQSTSSRITATLHNLEALMQNAMATLGSRGVQFNVQADELLAQIHQDLDLEEHYMKQITGKLTQSKELIRIGTLLNSSLNLEQVLQEVMDTIIGLTNATRAYLMLRKNETLVVRIARNWDRETLSNEEIVFSQGIIQAALTSKEVILSANVQADPRFQSMPSVHQHQLQSVFCVPLLAHDVTIGAIYADSGRRTMPFNTELIPVLMAFANQAAIAIENAQLFEQVQTQAQDLQRSREQIITAREEERRRLRRDLHDGLGPVLGSFTLKIDAVRKQVKRTPEVAEETLLDLKQEIKHTIDDVQRIVYDLRPPALDELGLIGALSEYTQQLGSLQVELDFPDSLPPLSAAAEVALYRITLEALTNITKHAQAEKCSIRLYVNHVLNLEITDDGCGMSPNRRAGVGLMSMQERAEELGGTYVIESELQCGTHILVSLPL